MIIAPICEKFVNDELNSGDKYFLDIEIWLKKDKFNRNIFVIAYVPENWDFYWINRVIEKNYSIEKILEKYGFDKDDEEIKKRIKDIINYRKWKLLYL
jgi:hypothetical protein